MTPIILTVWPSLNVMILFIFLLSQTNHTKLQVVSCSAIIVVIIITVMAQSCKEQQQHHHIIQIKLNVRKHYYSQTSHSTLKKNLGVVVTSHKKLIRLGQVGLRFVCFLGVVTRCGIGNPNKQRFWQHVQSIVENGGL